jgi:hypothetical protein
MPWPEPVAENGTSCDRMPQNISRLPIKIKAAKPREGVVLPAANPLLPLPMHFAVAIAPRDQRERHQSRAVAACNAPQGICCSPATSTIAQRSLLGTHNFDFARTSRCVF